MIVTVERYRAITGDETTTGDVCAERLTDAIGLLEDRLGRPLEQTERTAKLYPARDGRLYPPAVPLVAATGWTIDGVALVAQSWPAGGASCSSTVEVTYTGGWVERSANPTAPDRLPACIETDIAWAAHALAHPNPQLAAIPEGATSVRTGDVSVAFGARGAPRPGVAAIRWSRQTLAYAYRPPVGV